VQQGQIEARYLPFLLYGIALGLTFLHTMILYRQDSIGIPEIIAVMGLMNVLRFPVFISIFSFSLVQLGLAGARRMLEIITAETELDENTGGHSETIKGEIIFENVSFRYEDDTPFVLKDLSFRIEPGQTIAIVGQTGSGKSTLSQLINRTTTLRGADSDRWRGRARVGIGPAARANLHDRAGRIFVLAHAGRKYRVWCAGYAARTDRTGGA
jgi:ATP-binding cassette subfamily B protein